MKYLQIQKLVHETCENFDTNIDRNMKKKT